MDKHKEHEIEAQLEIWRVEIEARVVALATVDRAVPFDVLHHVDELKILLATARARFAALAASTGAQSGLEEEFTAAWTELAAAVGRPMPR